MEIKTKSEVTSEKKVSELELTINYLQSLTNKHKSAFQIIIFLLIFYFLYQNFTGILNIALMSYFIALIADPFVSRFEYKISRISGFCILLLIFFMFLFLLFGVLLPVIVRDYSGLISEVPQLITDAYKKFHPQIVSLLGADVIPKEQEIKDYLLSIVPQISSENVSKLIQSILSTLFAGFSATANFVNMLILPLLVFYFIKDWKLINKFMAHLIPREYRSHATNLAGQVNEIFNNFVKGQFMVSMVLATLYSIGLLILGLPYALPIGVVAGILGIIPYVGFFIGIALALLVQGSYNPTFLGFAGVLIAFSVVQTIESNFVTPKIVGETMDLHPLVVILALLIGGSALGILGLLIAIPLTAIFRLLITNYLRL